MSNVIQVVVTDGKPIQVSFPGTLTGQLLFGDIVQQETPAPAPDGVAIVFTITNAYRPGTLQIFRDQSVLLKGIDYEETTSTSFTLTKAPDSDEALRASYIKQ